MPDRDYPAKPSKGTVRILLAGGSVWAGSGVDQDKAIPRRLEAELKTLGLSDVEVINATTEGFSAWQNAILMTDFIEKYSPHLVLFHEFSMYPFQDLSEWPRLMTDADGRPLRYSPWTDELPRVMRDRLVKSGGMLHMFNGTFLEWSRILQSWKVAGGESESERLDRLLGPTVVALEMMRSACEKGGARFAVVIDGDDFTSRQLLVRGAHLYKLAALSRSMMLRSFRFPSARVEEKLKAKGFQTVSLLEGLPEREGKVISGDYHWDVEGSAIYGRQLARAVRPEVELVK